MIETDLKQTAQLIKEKRLAIGLTQQELADSCKLSLRSVQRIENAEVLPRAYTLKALSAQLNLDLRNSIVPEGTLLSPNKKLNRLQRLIITIISPLLMAILAAAFIFQSPTFPESTFEFLVLFAGLIVLYAALLLVIWK